MARKRLTLSSPRSTTPSTKNGQATITIVLCGCRGVGRVRRKQLESIARERIAAPAFKKAAVRSGTAEVQRKGRERLSLQTHRRLPDRVCDMHPLIKRSDREDRLGGLGEGVEAVLVDVVLPVLRPVHRLDLVAGVAAAERVRALGRRDGGVPVVRDSTQLAAVVAVVGLEVVLADLTHRRLSVVGLVRSAVRSLVVEVAGPRQRACKGSALVMKAVETQGKGSVIACTIAQDPMSPLRGPALRCVLVLYKRNIHKRQVHFQSLD